MTDPVTAEEIAELRAMAQAAANSGVTTAGITPLKLVALLTDLERLQAEVARLRGQSQACLVCEARERHAGPGVLDAPLKWRDAGWVWDAYAGPYACFAKYYWNDDDEPVFTEWVVNWGEATEDRPLTETRGSCTSLEDADRQVRAAIREHLEHAGLVGGKRAACTCSDGTCPRCVRDEPLERERHENFVAREALENVVDAWECSDGGASGAEHMAVAIDRARAVLGTSGSGEGGGR